VPSFQWSRRKTDVNGTFANCLEQSDINFCFNYHRSWWDPLTTQLVYHKRPQVAKGSFLLKVSVAPNALPPYPEGMALWRMIQDTPQSAAWNMAVDEAILTMSPALNRPTLRFYSWQRPTLSLGYFQSVTEVDAEACGQHDIDLVRRPTGGRAVLHHQEVTYSVVTGLDVLPGGVSASYRQISDVLIDALERLGLKAQLQRSHTKAQSSVCFDTPSFAELTVSGKKVCGSAQTRTKHALLQHGALPLQFDWERMAIALKLSDRVLNILQRQAAGLQEFVSITEEDLMRALKQSFELKFGPLKPSELTDEERKLAKKLSQEKYAHLDWVDHKEALHAAGC